MRLFTSLFVCMLLAGCFQQPQKQARPEPDPVTKADIEARTIQLYIDWVVSKKEEVSLADGTLEGIRLVVARKDEPNSMNHADITIYTTHEFYKEFDALRVGDKTSFLHMDRMDNSHATKTSAYLAPDCPRAVERFDKWYRYNVGP